jgi:hypothetical protein
MQLFDWENSLSSFLSELRARIVKPQVSNQNDPIQATMTYIRTLPTVMT